MDRDTVAAWYKVHRRIVIDYLNKIGVPAMHLHDLSQEVWIRVQRLGDEDATHPAAYLKTITRNVAYEWNALHRQRKMHLPFVFETRLEDSAISYESEEWTPSFMAEDPMGEIELCHRDLKRAIESAMAQLTPVQRQLVMMRAVYGLSYEEAAQRLNLSYRQVLRGLTVGYRKLRILLDDERQRSQRGPKPPKGQSARGNAGRRQRKQNKGQYPQQKVDRHGYSSGGSVGSEPASHV